MQEVVEAAIMACTKTKKLCVLALTILQKLVSHHLLSPASQKRVVYTLRQLGTSKAHDDETIKLKLLQTCLTLLQLKEGVADPEAARLACSIFLHASLTQFISSAAPCSMLGLQIIDFVF
jgi:hypothetical protein